MTTEAWRRHLPEGTPPPTLDGDGATLATAWTARWRADPTATALVELGKGSDPLTNTAAGLVRGSDPLTNADLDVRSAAAAGLLARAGVRAGDRVLLSGAPTVAYLLLYVGAVRLGAVVVPANTAYTAEELAHLVADSGATAAVVDDPARVALPALVPAQASFGGDAGGAVLDAAAPGDVAMIAYTSGTTGRPKGAMLTHRNLLASARAVVAAWRWTPADGLVLALPLFHLHGLGVGVHGSLVAGGRILLVGAFSPDAVAAAAAREDATMLFGVPTMHKRLVEHPQAAAALRSLRLVVSGSAPLPDELWHRIHQVTGQRVLERYGMTETVMNISNPYDGERRPGTVGLPLPGVEVRLAEDGEILLRGPNVFAGYHGRPDATAEAFTDDGWFRTGDLGRVDADGYYTIAGRSKELIITGGYNVYPREVEEVLERHPGVDEAAVVGVPDDDWGERVVAFVVAGTLDEPGLAALVAQHLAPYKRPRAYHRVDALPRNALGKVERARLADRAA